MAPKSYLALLDECFPGIAANINRCETLGFSWEASRLFLKEENGKVISHVGVLQCSMLVEGKWHTAAALHGICTRESQRGRGLASQLIQEALQFAKSCSDFIFLFTASPKFYERLSFRFIQEYRFHLRRRHPKGTKSLRPMIAPEDNALLLKSFRQRAPLSNHVWIKDTGEIAMFNALFATYPTYWSLHHSSSIDAIFSYQLKDKTLHLFDVVAKELPSLDLILDHLPSPIDEIYFYFSPDRLAKDAVPEPHLYDNGHFMVHGNCPMTQPFMISPLSRC